MSDRTLMDCAQAALMYSEGDARIIADAAEEITRLRAEVLEQARLLGLSGVWEAKLLARVAALEGALRRIQAIPHPSVAAQCTGCYSHQKTAIYALEDAAP